MQEIEEYQLVFFINGGGQFRFRLKGVTTLSTWKQCSSEDLAALAAIMNEKPLYYDAQRGAIGTQNEPVG